MRRQRAAVTAQGRDGLSPELAQRTAHTAGGGGRGLPIRSPGIYEPDNDRAEQNTAQLEGIDIPRMIRASLSLLAAYQRADLVVCFRRGYCTLDSHT